MKVKVNRKHFVDTDNIKLLEVDNHYVRIHRKKGYPKILKSDCIYDNFLLRMLNVGVKSKDIEDFMDKKTEWKMTK